MNYEIGKGLYKALKGAALAALALFLAQLGSADTIASALPDGTGEGLAIGFAAFVRFAANYLKVKGLLG